MCLSQLANYLVCVDSSKYGANAKKQTNKMKNGRDDTDVTPPLSLKRTLSLPSVQSDAAIRTQILAQKPQHGAVLFKAHSGRYSRGSALAQRGKK